jgi:hypothetical protein
MNRKPLDKATLQRRGADLRKALGALFQIGLGTAEESRAKLREAADDVGDQAERRLNAKAPPALERHEDAPTTARPGRPTPAAKAAPPRNVQQQPRRLGPGGSFSR